MANEQNLVRGEEAHKLTAEEQSRGGIASGKARRQKKLAKDIMSAYLNLPMDEGDPVDVDEIKSIKDIKGKNHTILTAGLAKVSKGVSDGNRADIELALKIAGEWVDRQQVSNIDQSIEAMDEYFKMYR